MVVPSSVSMAIPSSVSMAVPSSVSMAVPSSVSMAVPSSVSMAVPLSTVDTMSRHVSVVQQPANFLAASSPQILSAAINSIPPSRDPITGGLTPGGVNLTPTVTVRESNYAAAAFKDSQPVASDLLVERLEEISTQRDLADDPER